jgi:hypothetical protein
MDFKDVGLTGYEQVAESCENNNITWNPIKFGEFN